MQKEQNSRWAFRSFGAPGGDTSPCGLVSRFVYDQKPRAFEPWVLTPAACKKSGRCRVPLFWCTRRGYFALRARVALRLQSEASRVRTMGSHPCRMQKERTLSRSALLVHPAGILRPAGSCRASSTIRSLARSNHGFSPLPNAKRADAVAFRSFGAPGGDTSPCGLVPRFVYNQKPRAFEPWVLTPAACKKSGRCCVPLFWCTRRGSNPQPSASEADTLSNCATSAKSLLCLHYNTSSRKMLYIFGRIW